MKIDANEIERKFNMLIAEIEEMTIHFVNCHDEEINENSISYLDRCHLRQREIDSFFECGVIGYTMSCALYDYVQGLIARHLGIKEHVSKITNRYAPFEI